MKAQLIYNLPVAVTVEMDDDGTVAEVYEVRELGDLIEYDDSQHVTITNDDGSESGVRGDGSWAQRVRIQADRMEWPVRR